MAGLGNQGGGMNSGNKGSNHNYEHRHLLALGEQLQALGLLATEATLTSVLNAIVAHQDMEILLVRDTGNGDVVVQQVREYDETTQTWSTVYQDVNGAPYVPTGPLAYLDPSAVLNLILTELLDQGLSLDAMVTDLAAIEVELLDQGISLDAVVTDLAAIEVELLDQGTTLDNIETEQTAQGLSLDAMVTDLAAIETELLDQGTSLDALVVDAAAIETELLAQGLSLDAMVTDLAAIEVELLDQGTTLDAILVDTGQIETELLDQGTTLDNVETLLTATTRTHNTVSTSTTGSVASGSMRGSVMNVGASAGTWNGISIPAGVTIPWGPIGNRDTYGAISYDATGTTFIIEYTT